MRVDAICDLVSASLGFASSAVLLVTAFRSAPLERLLETIKDTGPRDPGYELAVALSNHAKTHLSRIRLWDSRLLLTGIVLLALSYAVAVAKDFVFSGL